MPPRFEVIPYTITEEDVDITAKDTVANVESEHLNYRVPDRTACKIKRGSRFFLYIATSGPTQIVTGTVRLYKASVDKTSKRDIIAIASPDELDGGGTPENKDNQYTIKRDIVIGSKGYLLCTFEGTEIADDAQLKFRLDVIKVMEID